MPVEGGTAVTLCAGQGGRGGTWGGDGTIVASLSGTTLSRIPDAGSTPTKLTELVGGEIGHRWPLVLPGDKSVLFSVRPVSGTSDDGNIDLLSLRDGHRKTLIRGGMFGRYFTTSKDGGYLLYVTKGTLFAISFDLDRLQVLGPPSPVLEDVGFSNITGAAQFDASVNGTLVYRSGLAGALLIVQWLDAAGKTQLLPAKPGAYGQPHVSPDGKRLALSVTTASGQDVWVYDWQRDTMSRLTFGGGTFGFPVWHSSGRYIAFTGEFRGAGMFWTRADGATRPQPLTPSKAGQFPWSFSPDGKRLAFADFASGSQAGDIWTVPVENGGAGLKAGKPEVFLQTPANEVFPDAIGEAREIRRPVEADDLRYLQHDALWDGSEVLHQLVQRVGQRGSNLAREMRVDLGRPRAAMAEGVLHDPQIDPLPISASSTNGAVCTCARFARPLRRTARWKALCKLLRVTGLLLLARLCTSPRRVGAGNIHSRERCVRRYPRSPGRIGVGSGT